MSKIYKRYIIKRILATLKFIPHQLHMDLTWKYETCERCGRPFHICWWTSNELWNKYSGHSDGSGDLCPDCFIELCLIAEKELKDSDIKMVPFQPDCEEDGDE